RGEGYGCRGGEVERGRLVTHDALVDGVEVGVRAFARDVSGVVDLVADREAGHLGTDRRHRARRIESEPGGCTVRQSATSLGVDRVHRDRLDAHQEVARTQLGEGNLDLAEGRCLGDRSGRSDDGGHGTGHAKTNPSSPWAIPARDEARYPSGLSRPSAAVSKPLPVEVSIRSLALATQPAWIGGSCKTGER